MPNRLLILINDGVIYDQGHESLYAEADAAGALTEACSEGFACVCLCVGAAADAEKLRKAFGLANLLLAGEPQRLLRGIRQACRLALVSGSRRCLYTQDEPAASV